MVLEWLRLGPVWSGKTTLVVLYDEQRDAVSYSGPNALARPFGEMKYVAVREWFLRLALFKKKIKLFTESDQRVF